MTMNFETIQTNIISILSAAAAGRFRVAGFQPKTDDAAEYLNDSRLVSVFFSESQVPDSMGSIQGESVHWQATYRIELFVSASAKGDLATLANESSTPAQLQAALAGVKSAEKLADDSWNEVAGIIYQILMDARNRDVGLDPGIASSRWISNIRKDRPAQIDLVRGVLGGKYITVTGSLDFNCLIDEPIVGDTGTAAYIFDNVIDITDDDNERTGVLIDNTPSP